MKFWVFKKRLRRAIAFKQTKRMGNLVSTFLNKDNILLSSGCVNILIDKEFLSSSFDLGDEFFILRIETHRDKRKGYYGYCKGILRKASKEMKYANE